MIQYGRQSIDDEDVEMVRKVMLGDYLTTGPWVAQFEEEYAAAAGYKYGVAVSSGTAALHTAMHIMGVQPGDEVIVPPMTFVATANAVLYEGGSPEFCDVNAKTLLLDYKLVAKCRSRATKLTVVVSYGGQDTSSVIKRIGGPVLLDASHCAPHAISPCADLAICSFHPVKFLTMGEGGILLINDEYMADAAKQFRCHGVNVPSERRVGHEYDIVELGMNYRVTDMQCALGLSQLGKAKLFAEKRMDLALEYDRLLKDLPVEVLARDANLPQHIYVIGVKDRDGVYNKMRAAGIGVNVHYKPVYLHSFYREMSYELGLCPVAEELYTRILTLPLHPGMSNEEVGRVVDALKEAIE